MHGSDPWAGIGRTLTLTSSAQCSTSYVEPPPHCRRQANAAATPPPPGWRQHCRRHTAVADNPLLRSLQMGRYIFSCGVSRSDNLQTRATIIMWPNEPRQPDLTQPKFGPWGPGPTLNRVQIGFIWVNKVHYRVQPEFEPYLRPTPPDSTRILSPKSGSTPKNGSGRPFSVYDSYTLKGQGVHHTLPDFWQIR